MSISLEQVKWAIFGQESSHGAADTSKENYTGARGPMQVTKDTFEGMKRNGLIPADYDHANPKHTTDAGNRLIEHLWNRFGGNPAHVAAAYYAGEKAVKSNGEIIDYRDKKNDKAPSTLQYVAQVLKRAGQPTDALPTGGVAAPAAELGPTDLSLKMPDLTKPADGGARSIAGGDAFVKVPSLGLAKDGTPGAAFDSMVPERDALVKAETERKNTSFIDLSRAAFNSDLLGTVMRAAVRPDYTPEKGFAPDLKKAHERLGVMTDADIEQLSGAVSQAHYDRLLWEIEDLREQDRIAGVRGAGWGVAAAMFAGLPAGYVTGMAAARGLQLARAGSLELAAQGRTGAAVGSSVLENLGGNVVTQAAQGGLDPHFNSLEDYGMAAAMALLPVGLEAPTINRIGKEGSRIRSLLDKMVAEASDRHARLERTATANLGPDATAEQVQAEINRISRAEIASQGTGDGVVLPGEGTAAANMAYSTDADLRDPGNYGGSSDAWRAPGDSWLQDPWMRSSQSSQINRRLSYPGQKEAFDVEKYWGAQPGLYFDTKSGSHKYADVAQWIQKNFLNDTKVVIVDEASMGHRDGLGSSTQGEAWYVGANTVVIRSREGAGHKTLVHELGHAVMFTQVRRILDNNRDAVWQAFKDLHTEWRKEYFHGEADSALMKRGSPTSNYTNSYFGTKHPEGAVLSLFDVIAKYGSRDFAGNYIPNFDEFGAENFNKYIEAAVMKELGWKPASVPKSLVDALSKLWNMMAKIVNKFREAGLIAPDERSVDFWEAVRKENRKAVNMESRTGITYPQRRKKLGVVDDNRLPTGMADSLVHQQQTPQVNIDLDPIAQKHGLNMLPRDTEAAMAELKAILAYYKEADGKFKPDEKRLSKLLDTAVFEGAQSTANILARSENPVARMVAATLLENPSGSQGRRKTAAMAKYLNEKRLLANTLNDVQAAYTHFRREAGDTVVGDTFNGRTWADFNRKVAEEIESRRAGIDNATSEWVKKAADHLEQAYERARTMQVEHKTVGWAALPESSRGYMPHRLSPEKVLNMTPAQHKALHSALVDQFITVEGWDITFAANLASKYIERVRTRALGGFDAIANMHHTGAADVVEDALDAMGMSKAEVRQMMEKYLRGAANHTKKRLNLDLLRTYETEGGTFRLLDLMETDQFALLRRQAHRVSGEAALADAGVMGSAGLKLLRRALQASNSEKVTAREMEAFDQVAAEFLGSPFGTQSKWVDRAMQVNSLARLGGMGFTQFAEALNGIWHVGAARTLSAIMDLPRLRKEIKALAAGQPVNNPILDSIEKFGGAEFGTSEYKTVFPFDNGSLQYHTYGQDTATAADRMLRGATHVQGSLSMWRMLHATQQRGMAEQIVRKAIDYIRAGGEGDKALADMGISPELAARMRAEFFRTVQTENGAVTGFDITRMEDQEAAGEFVQAIHRGVAQIIQGTFIGEQGKWAHSAQMRLLTQFRTFSLTAVEKQWGRQAGSHGIGAALGMMIGSMSMAAPIYIGRVIANAAGREDRDEYIEKNLTAEKIARASLNYIAMSGLAGDLLDSLSAITGISDPSGGRGAAAGQGFVGNVVAPSAGLLDDAYRAIQNTKEGNDPHDLLKTLPFNRLPFVVPAINALGE